MGKDNWEKTIGKSLLEKSQQGKANIENTIWKSQLGKANLKTQETENKKAEQEGCFSPSCFFLKTIETIGTIRFSFMCLLASKEKNCPYCLYCL